MNYHAALSDTLLGLRVLMGDPLIIEPDCADPPRQGDEYVLGEGEAAPDVAENEERLVEVLEALPMAC